MSKSISEAQILVVKIGSSLLVDASNGDLRVSWLQALAADISRCRARGQHVLVVSSGAIALGRRALKLKPENHRLETNQAAAATGQIRLAHAYQEALVQHDINSAQVLLTGDDTESRRRYLNARNTLNTLLQLGVVPIINENDTVATDEIRYGDNDRLAARVAQMVSADCLILLSDIDGLYTSDPNKNHDAKLVPEVLEITEQIEAMASTSGTSLGSGGMITKITAARIAMEAGCSTVISEGNQNSPLSALEKGVNCTWFLPVANPRAARKNWIASGLQALGALTLDKGAIAALRDGKSLLPAGVSQVAGSFQRGEAVILINKDGLEIGRGLTAYSDADAKKIIGHKSDEIEKLLGYRGRDEMIHRDDMILLESKINDN